MVFGEHKYGDMTRFLITNAILGAPAGSKLLIEAAYYTLQHFSHTHHYNMGGLAHIAQEYKLEPFDYAFFYPHYYNEPEERYRVFTNTHSIHLWHRHLDYDVGSLRRVAARAIMEAGHT
jgi:hypothetical protein